MSTADVIFWPQGSTEIECYKCHAKFAISEQWKRELLRTQEIFYCPNGHCQHFVNETEEERLRWKLTITESTLEKMRAQWNEANLQRDRLRERAKRGRCPASRACKVRFHDLSEHLKQSHKRYPWRKQ